MTATTKDGFSLSREFDAPPMAVFEAWTKPELLGWYFNPDNPVTVPLSVDLRVGGQWRQQMVIDAHTNYITGGVYREIVPGRRLVFSMGAVGGWPALSLDALDEAPLVTVEFSDIGGRTRMDLRLELPPGYVDERFGATLDQMRAGWGMTIDRLVADLRSKRAAPAA